MWKARNNFIFQDDIIDALKVSIKVFTSLAEYGCVSLMKYSRVAHQPFLDVNLVTCFFMELNEMVNVGLEW